MSKGKTYQLGKMSIADYDIEELPDYEVEENGKCGDMLVSYFCCSYSSQGGLQIITINTMNMITNNYHDL